MSPLARWLRTVQPLRARQVAGQLSRRLAPLWERPEAFARRPAPAWPGVAWAPRAGLLAPTPRGAAVDPGEGSFEFLNRRERLGWPPDWDAPGLPALWRYHLHYFEPLLGLDFADARALASDWILRHDLRRGRVGWDAYPTSLRLLNWCGAFFGRHRAATAADPRRASSAR